MTRDAVLLTAHGTVERIEDLPAFLATIRRGRPAPPELVAEVERRYRAIGGSPLLEITREQARKLKARLGIEVLVGMRLAEPFLGDVYRDACMRGIERIVSLPLAPQSVHVYHEALREAHDRVAREDAKDPQILEVPAWGTEARFLDALSACIDDALATVTPERRAEVPIVLTAHSLPSRVIASGDPYEKDFRTTCEALIAARKEPSRRTLVAFQSQGMDGGDWLGPDLATTLKELAGAGEKEVVVAPIGFVTEHVETLYDLDIEAKGLAESLGMRFVRAPAPNARNELVDALEVLARRALA